MRRYEIKFDASEINLNKITSSLNLIYLYPQRKIISIYYDTKQLNFFNDSEEGIVPRRKIRLRFYNDSNSSNLEIKETRNDFRRKFMFKNVNDKKLNKILKKNFMYIENLEPVVKVEYNRKYFKCIYGRITYDYNIKYLNLKENYNRVFSNKKILELKNEDLGLKDKFIKKFFLKNIRFSKYCDAVNIFLDGKINN